MAIPVCPLMLVMPVPDRGSNSGTDAMGGRSTARASFGYRRDRLVVRREERDRVEASSKEKRLGLVDRFEHSGDYRDVRIGNLELTLGAVQANVVRALHAASLSDQPWCAGKALLRDAGATSMRMRDAFKSQKEWPRLIESDNRGRATGSRSKPE